MLVIFDVDGTLLDSWDWMAGELVRSAARFGYREIDRSSLERLRGLETREVLAALEVPPSALPGLVAHLRQSAEGSAKDLRTFEGIPELLADLRRQGDVLALVSSNSDAAVRAALGAEVNDCFALRRCGTGVFDKAAEFEAIVRESGVEPSSALAVGDETRDVDAAVQAGIEPIAVEWGYADAALLRAKAPGRTAATVEQLSALIADKRRRTAAGAPPTAPGRAPISAGGE